MTILDRWKGTWGHPYTACKALPPGGLLRRANLISGLIFFLRIVAVLVLSLAEGTAAMVGIVFRTITTTARMNAMMLSLGFRVCD